MTTDSFSTLDRLEANGKQYNYFSLRKLGESSTSPDSPIR